MTVAYVSLKLGAIATTLHLYFRPVCVCMFVFVFVCVCVCGRARARAIQGAMHSLDLALEIAVLLALGYNSVSGLLLHRDVVLHHPPFLLCLRLISKLRIWKLWGFDSGKFVYLQFGLPWQRETFFILGLVTIVRALSVWMGRITEAQVLTSEAVPRWPWLPAGLQWQRPANLWQEEKWIGTGPSESLHRCFCSALSCIL